MFNLIKNIIKFVNKENMVKKSIKIITKFKQRK